MLMDFDNDIQACADVTEWILVDSEHCDADDKNQYPYSFLTYERAGKLA